MNVDGEGIAVDVQTLDPIKQQLAQAAPAVTKSRPFCSVHQKEREVPRACLDGVGVFRIGPQDDMAFNRRQGNIGVSDQNHRGDRPDGYVIRKIGYRRRSHRPRETQPRSA
ncbi:MAG: hypothetical protein CMM47_11665 [Rhodospirillaceae bacterium]|nr:hypothetical protein [Rhodospirillaceae bacterium]